MPFTTYFLSRNQSLRSEYISFSSNKLAMTKPTCLLLGTPGQACCLCAAGVPTPHSLDGGTCRHDLHLFPCLGTHPVGPKCRKVFISALFLMPETRNNPRAH